MGKERCALPLDYAPGMISTRNYLRAVGQILLQLTLVYVLVSSKILISLAFSTPNIKM